MSRPGQWDGRIGHWGVAPAVLLLLVSLLASAEAGSRRVPADLSTVIVQVAKQNIPAVVHIEVIERQEVANPFFEFQNDPFFRHFFGNPGGRRKFQRELRGLGTGMIIDRQGHILTNHHVAGGARRIEVSISDGRQFPAKLVGSDPKTDLAVVRISAKESPSARRLRRLGQDGGR